MELIWSTRQSYASHFLLLLLAIVIVTAKATQDDPKSTSLSEECVTDDNDGNYVCGSNGITYANHIALRCASNNERSENISVVYRGKCEDPCWQAIHPEAPKIQDNICASDGIVYPSAIVLDCINQQDNENRTMVEMSNCDAQDNMAMESAAKKNFDPCLQLAYVASRKICASDNVTYNNIWHMVCTANMYDVVGLQMQHEGECNITCPYSPIYNPVCSTLEYMFANVEALKCRQLLSPYIKNDFHHQGHCARYLSQNPCYVDNAYNPVCATNGRTYSSPHYVRCLKQSNPALNVLHSGPCSLEDVKKILQEPSEACLIAAHHHEWNPLCGSDNVTYGNPFRFLCSSLNKTLDVSVAYTGECGGFDYCRLRHSDESDKEVCGNVGVTYKNMHSLYCMQSKQKHLQLSHKESCTSSDDPCLIRGSQLDHSGTPVCASNGVTYVSPQAIWCAAKTDQGIEFKHDGECF